MTLLKFTFPKSRAKDFATLLDSCRLFENFTEGETYELLLNKQTEILKHWQAFKFVATFLPSIVNAKAWFNDEPVFPFSNALFAEIEDKLFYCYEMGYDEVLMPDHCLSNWGCRYLKNIARLHYNDSNLIARHWCNYGKLDGDVWVLDKEALLRALTKEAKEKKLSICPIFSIATVKEHIETLPDEIIVDENWMVLVKRAITEEGVKKLVYDIVPPNTDELDKPIAWEEKSKEEIDGFLDRWLRLKGDENKLNKGLNKDTK